MMESILRWGLLHILIAAQFIGAVLWGLATLINKMRVASVASIKKSIAVQYDKRAQANMTFRTVIDVSIDSKPVWRVNIGLFEENVPKIVERFVKLAAGKFGTGYKGSE